MSEEYVVSKDIASRMNPFAPDHTNEPIETMDFSNINTIDGKNLADVNVNPSVNEWSPASEQARVPNAGYPNSNSATNKNTVDGKNLADVNVNPSVNEWSPASEQARVPNAGYPNSNSATNINTVDGKNLTGVNVNPSVQVGQPNPNPTTNINTVDGKNLADVNVNPHVNEWVSTNDTVITNTNAPKSKEFIDSLLRS